MVWLKHRHGTHPSPTLEHCQAGTSGVLSYGWDAVGWHHSGSDDRQQHSSSSTSDPSSSARIQMGSSGTVLGKRPRQGLEKHETETFFFYIGLC